MLDPLIQIVVRLRGYNPIEVLLEVALIWIVVYAVLRFLRGTRGARVLKGVGLVVVIAMLLVTLLGSEVVGGFERLRYLLQGFVYFATLALVIVFQPELRRALTRLGEGAKLFRAQAVEMDAVIDEVIKAVGYLSKNKIGAIMAIEREEGLKGIVEAGTKMDAEVSAELIKTIFWPGSTLHDMGMVITGSKIVAAGVQFPLAPADELSQELGSRHRAAVGLSQEADCLVVVVSEETGAISLAERGQLLRKLTADGLRAMLRRALSRPRPGASGPRREARAETSEARPRKKRQAKAQPKADETAAGAPS